jgi:hypothetical protein
MATCYFPEVLELELMHHTGYTYMKLYNPENSNRTIKRCYPACEEHHLYVQCHFPEVLEMELMHHTG